MTTQVTKSLMVNVPVSRAYNQWTQFEDFPQFMGGIQSVTQLSDDRLQWVAQIAGVRRQWEAKILEQVPDQKVAWAATEGATNAGSVSFEDLGGDQCRVTLFLEYEPEGLVEKAGDALNVIERQAESDLERFKTFIESEDYASGAWRGSVEAKGHVGTPGVEHASESQGDSGKAGVSGKVVAAGLGVAAAAAAAAVVGARSGSDDDTTDTSVSTPPARVDNLDVSAPVTPVVSPQTAGTSDLDTSSAGTSDFGTSGVDVSDLDTVGTEPVESSDQFSGKDVGAASTVGTGLGGDSDARMLSDAEIDAGASDVPLGEGETKHEH